jgi:hypothetical protein
MSDRHTDVLVQRLEGLPPSGKRRVLDYLRFEEERAQPWHTEEADSRLQEYNSKLETVRDLKERISFVSADVRNILHTALPKDKRELLTEFELLTFFIFLANYKTYCLFNERGSEFKMAKESVARVYRMLVKLKKAEKETEGGRHDKP